VIVARLRKCSDLIREGKVFVKNKTKVASRVGYSERAVLYFRELLFKSIKKKFSFRRVESEKIGIVVASHHDHDVSAILRLPWQRPLPGNGTLNILQLWASGTQHVNIVQ